MLILLAGCAGGRTRFAAASAAEAVAEQTAAALAVADQERATGRALPDYPPECRRTHRSGVTVGDRLDAALIKTDRTLAAANNQIGACTEWYDELRAGVAVE